MKIKTTYIGTVNGVFVITNGEKPADMVVTDEVLVLYADEGKILQNKEDKERRDYSIVIEDPSEQLDWDEIDDPDAQKME